MPEPTPPTNDRRRTPGPQRPPALPPVPGFGRPSHERRPLPDEQRPLPDATAIRRLAVPACAPPYDDELTAAEQQSAALTSRPAGSRPAGSGPAGGGPGPRRPPGSGPPDSAAAARPGWPGQFAQVLAETLAGSRPPRQIVPWTTEEARRHIRRLGPMLAAGDRPLVRRVLATHPAADVVEMTVIVRFGPRVRALAIRMERTGPRGPSPGRQPRAERWLCTAVEAA